MLLNPYAAGGLFGQCKTMQKTLKITETLANGNSSESTQQELSNEYQNSRVLVVFKNLCVLVLRMKVASALKGLSYFTLSDYFTKPNVFLLQQYLELLMFCPEY